MLDSLDIGYAIKDRRKELGLTQEQVAASAGVSKRCLWSLELGRNPGVQLDKLLAVFGVLGLDLDIVSGGGYPHGGEAEMALDEDTGGATLVAATSLGQNESVRISFDPIAVLMGGERE